MIETNVVYEDDCVLGLRPSSRSSSWEPQVSGKYVLELLSTVWLPFHVLCATDVDVGSSVREETYWYLLWRA